MIDTAIGFLALTKGRKPTSEQEWQNATGYKKQINSIRDAAARHGFKSVAYVRDHSTYAKANWFTRSRFRAAVREVVDHNQTLIIFDLIGMLAKCSIDDQLKWWKYLITLPVPVIDALSMRKLQGFNDREIVSLVHNRRRDKSLSGTAIKQGLDISDHRGAQPSQSMRKRAEKHRTHNAHLFAQSTEEIISQVKSELAKDKDTPTLQRIATELNNRQVKARRGGEWTAAGVKRVQDRLKTLIKK